MPTVAIFAPQHPDKSPFLPDMVKTIKMKNKYGNTSTSMIYPSSMAKMRRDPHTYLRRVCHAFKYWFARGDHDKAVYQMHLLFLLTEGNQKQCLPSMDPLHIDIAHQIESLPVLPTWAINKQIIETWASNQTTIRTAFFDVS